MIEVKYNPDQNVVAVCWNSPESTLSEPTPWGHLSLGDDGKYHADRDLCNSLSRHIGALPQHWNETTLSYPVWNAIFRLFETKRSSHAISRVVFF